MIDSRLVFSNTENPQNGVGKLGLKLQIYKLITKCME